jgi:ankyrin repeat protein
MAGCVTMQQPELIQSLRKAAIDGNIDAAKQAIADGADVNAKSDGEYTPLNIAAYWGRKEIIELLLANGADVNAKTNWDGSTPLHFAAENDHKEIAELLIANSADVNALKDDGKTPLDWADNKGITDLLRQHGGKTGEELKGEGN